MGIQSFSEPRLLFRSADLFPAQQKIKKANRFTKDGIKTLVQETKNQPQKTKDKSFAPQGFDSTSSFLSTVTLNLLKEIREIVTSAIYAYQGVSSQVGIKNSAADGKRISFNKGKNQLDISLTVPDIENISDEVKKQLFEKLYIAKDFLRVLGGNNAAAYAVEKIDAYILSEMIVLAESIRINRASLSDRVWAEHSAIITATLQGLEDQFGELLIKKEYLITNKSILAGASLPEEHAHFIDILHDKKAIKKRYNDIYDTDIPESTSNGSVSLESLRRLLPRELTGRNLQEIQQNNFAYEHFLVIKNAFTNVDVSTINTPDEKKAFQYFKQRLNRLSKKVIDKDIKFDRFINLLKINKNNKGVSILEDIQNFSEFLPNAEQREKGTRYALTKEGANAYTNDMNSIERKQRILERAKNIEFPPTSEIISAGFMRSLKNKNENIQEIIERRLEAELPTDCPSKVIVEDSFQFTKDGRIPPRISISLPVGKNDLYGKNAYAIAHNALDMHWEKIDREIEYILKDSNDIDFEKLKKYIDIEGVFEEMDKNNIPYGENVTVPSYEKAKNENLDNDQKKNKREKAVLNYLHLHLGSVKKAKTKPEMATKELCPKAIIESIKEDKNGNKWKVIEIIPNITFPGLFTPKEFETIFGTWELVQEVNKRFQKIQVFNSKKKKYEDMIAIKTGGEFWIPERILFERSPFADTEMTKNNEKAIHKDFLEGMETSAMNVPEENKFNFYALEYLDESFYPEEGEKKSIDKNEEEEDRLGGNRKYETTISQKSYEKYTTEYKIMITILDAFCSNHYNEKKNTIDIELLKKDKKFISLGEKSKEILLGSILSANNKLTQKDKENQLMDEYYPDEDLQVFWSNCSDIRENKNIIEMIKENNKEIEEGSWQWKSMHFAISHFINSLSDEEKIYLSQKNENKIKNIVFAFNFSTIITNQLFKNRENQIYKKPDWEQSISSALLKNISKYKEFRELMVQLSEGNEKEDKNKIASASSALSFIQIGVKQLSKKTEYGAILQGKKNEMHINNLNITNPSYPQETEENKIEIPVGYEFPYEKIQKLSFFE